MDKIKQQIAMKLKVSYHDILDYAFEFVGVHEIHSKLKVTVVGKLDGAHVTFDKIKTLSYTDPSILSVDANVSYQSPSLTITVNLILLIGDKFTVLVTRAMYKTFKDSHEQYKAHIKQRGNAAASRLATRPS